MTTDLQLPEILSRLSAIPVRSDAEIREWTWRNEIRPILADAGFDGRFRERADWNLEPNQEKVFRVVRSKLLGEGAIIALVGIRGTGKTTISAQIAIQIAEEWVAYWNQSQRRENAPIGLPIYRKMLSIVEILKPLYSDHGSTRTDSLVAMRDALCSIGLLIIDEKHDANALNVAPRILTDIIDRRYSAKKDTIIISNESAVEFEQNTDDSIISRLSEHGMIVPCNWPSMRARKINCFTNAPQSRISGK